MSVTVTRNDTIIRVQSPYNSEFVRDAKRLGGKWRDKQWVFDARDESRVRDLCRRVYGTDGTVSDTVTLRVEWREADAVTCGAITVGGRTIARAIGRDSGARLGDGVVLLNGEFRSGGSTHNWSTTVDAGTVVLVRDFSRTLAESLESGVCVTYAIEPDGDVDRDALIAERETLLRRVAEIDRLLQQSVERRIIL